MASVHRIIAPHANLVADAVLTASSVAPVAAQWRGQDLDPGGPQTAAARVGEPALAGADQEHAVPFQALGAMDGEQLDRVGLGRGGDVEALPVLLGLQPGEQGRERHRTVDRLELGDGLDEQVEVLASCTRRVADRGGELDIDPAGVDDAPDELEQRLPGVGPQ